MNDLVLIGKIVGTFGIKGELKINSESDFVEYRFRVNATIYFEKEPHKVSSFRMHKGNVLITIDDINDINLVLSHIGKNVFASSNDMPPLNDDEYYIDSLVGLKVYNQKNEFLGEVTDIIEIPSGYILEIKNDEKKFLMPFVDEFVKHIDDEKIIIEEIEGLR